MKKILLIVLLFICMNSFALADDCSQIPYADYKKKLMTNWLKNHPEKATELNSVLQNSKNQTQDLQKWLDANKEAAKELQKLVMPDGEK